MEKGLKARPTFENEGKDMLQQIVNERGFEDNEENGQNDVLTRWLIRVRGERARAKRGRATLKSVVEALGVEQRQSRC